MEREPQQSALAAGGDAVRNVEIRHGLNFP
jgi:hypothetical protein